MKAMQQVNEEQAAMWNGAAGRAWVETQVLLDRVMKPFEDMIVEAIVAKSPSRLLDVGCGTGATTIAAAQRIGAGCACLGVDLSAPMIDAARVRAGRESVHAEFVCADAQTHRFDSVGFDMIVSRFGVMFFDDPVTAFANFRRAATDDAELRFLAWRGPAENPFMTIAERAAAPLLPAMPARDFDAPGQFAFADRRRIERVLADSGWVDVDIRPIDVSCGFPLSELEYWFTQLGPLGRVLHDADARTRTRIVEAIRPAYDRYVHGDEVRFDTACWRVAARSAPSTAGSGRASHG
jgi:SAM-dependent methyltransferase